MHALPWLTWVPVAAIGSLVLLAVTAPDLASAVALPLALVGAALGVPHGAVDHLVPWWWGRREPRSAGTGGRGLALFALGYAGVAALAIAAFLLAPTPTLVAFLVLSAVHFGRGEVVTSAERAGRRAPGGREDWATTLAHGLVVVGLLLWARPADTDPLLRPLSPWLADAVLTLRAPGLAAVAAAVTAGLIWLVRRRRRLDAAELGLLALAFALTPPLAAFGVYFGLWHSVRHTGRLLDLARTRDGRPTSWLAAGRTLARAAAGPTLAAGAAIGVLWWARDLAGLQAEVAVLLALTFPHACVVWALDWQQSAPARVWAH